MEAHRAALGRERHRTALRETLGRSPLTGIELARRRSREIRRLEQVVGSAVVLGRLGPALWSRTPRRGAITGDETEPPDLNRRRTRKDVLLPAARTAGTTDAVVEGKGVARLRQVPRPAAYGFRPAGSSSHSSACERARRAASRARTAARRSSAASSLRPARSCLSACASASAAVSSSAAAVRLSTNDRCAALACIRPSTRSAALPGSSTASGSIASGMMAPLFRLAWSGVSAGISRSAVAPPFARQRRPTDRRRLQILG